MRSWLVAIFGFALAVPSAPAHAADDQHHQHHHHHGSAEQLGEVHFPTTCREDVQPAFDRAMAWLHSFGYEEAREAFEGVATEDPSCGMAHWGIAMTHYHPLWAPPTPAEFQAGRAAAVEAARIGAKSDRERRYIEAIGRFYQDPQTPHGARAKAYLAAMESLSAAHADDDEAKIFYALALVGTAPPHDTTYAQQKQAAALLHPLIAKNPQHPGVLHYLIHAFDYPELAPLALEAARTYAKVAAASPHALHMPSHIFTRLGLWDECIASNLDSADAARAQTTHAETASFNRLHALDYLAYGYLQLGDDRKAAKVLEEVEQATRFDEANLAAAYAVVAVPARYALERRDWATAARLQVPPVVRPLDSLAYVRAVTMFANALGAARQRDAAAAARTVQELEVLHATLAKQPPGGPYDWAGQVESMYLAAKGWTAWAEGQHDRAVDLLTAAAEKEELVGKHPVTPGSILPARELLGDLLLELKRPSDALAAYERSLGDAPRRLNTLAGAVQAGVAANEKDRARRYAEELATLCGEQCDRAAVKQARAAIATR